jgi:hypothetical protein
MSDASCRRRVSGECRASIVFVAFRVVATIVFRIVFFFRYIVFVSFFINHWERESAYGFSNLSQFGDCGTLSASMQQVWPPRYRVVIGGSVLIFPHSCRGV